MAVDITNINRLTFGVNFLGENGAKEVNQLWNSRFSGKEAYLVSADPQTNPRDIFNEFCSLLDSGEQTELVGRECLLTFFVDYTAQLPQAAEKAVWGMKKVMEAQLGCNIQAVIQFAFVGKRGDATGAQRANVKKALENNAKKQAYENYRLILVGKSVLKNQADHNWKAAVILTDLLRRCDAVSNYLPVADKKDKTDLGFLRYGEFDEARYQALLADQKRVTEQLADAKPDGLRALVEEQRKTLIGNVEKRYPIDGAMHPQHPGMIVPEKARWYDPDLRKDAEKGKNAAYNEAVKATREAVEATGRRMCREIEAEFARHIAQADETLAQMFEESNAGIKLKLDQVGMRTALHMHAYSVPSTMPKLTFKYSVQGVADEIRAYLEYMKMEAIAAGLREYQKALAGAYEKIPVEELKAQKKKLETERDEIAQQIDKTLSAQGFCEFVAQNYPPESIFDINNLMTVDNRKFLLTRFDHIQTADSAAQLGIVEVLGINDPMSGIVRFDSAPIKALMVESVACSRDWVLDHFLPEVEQDEFDF